MPNSKPGGENDKSAKSKDKKAGNKKQPKGTKSKQGEGETPDNSEVKWVDNRKGCLCFKRRDDFRSDWYTMVDIELPWLITKLSEYCLIWEIFMYIIVIINYLFLTYGIFFSHYNNTVWFIVLATDWLYALDVVIRLMVEIWRYINQSDLLVFTLPYRLLYCLLDLITLFPITSIAVLFHDTNSLNTMAGFPLYRIIGFFRLYRAYVFFEILENLHILTDEVLFLMRYFNMYFVFMNCVSCIFFLFLLVPPINFLMWRDLHFIDNSWAKDYKDKKPGHGQDPWDMYILSNHLGVATTTTVGYGDIHGETEGEMMFSVFIMLAGAIFLNGMFSGEITNLQLQIDGARFDLFHRLDGIQAHLTEILMPDFFLAKVELYYKCLWTYREGVDTANFIHYLPRSIQEDMYYDICVEMFYKSFLFRGLDETFLRAVSKITKIALYNPDMILCRFGGYANQMFYILQGECQAMSKHESSKRAAVLRAGSIIGEMNLFFSCPYTVSVETSTCCQFISIEKEELMGVFNKFPVELMILRNRCVKKVNLMYKIFDVLGEDPVCWVQRRELDEEEDPNANTHKSGIIPPPKTIARWGDGFNAIVQEDVILDVDRFVIFETSCEIKKLKKNHVTPYMTCVVPEILNSKLPWVLCWNVIIMILALIYSFIGPYCLAFGASSQLEHYICLASSFFQYINVCFFMVDVFVEILGACPVEGLYYKFKDGLQMKSREILFYFDILAAIPVEFIPDNDSQNILHVVNVIVKSMKIWKVIRYLKFLDNVYPKELFWFRLGQTFLVLMYTIHFSACFLFLLACPVETVKGGGGATGVRRSADKVNCRDSSWIASYKINSEFSNEPVHPEHEPSSLGKNAPYLVSFHFAAATITSAGFGDFSPHTIIEMISCFFFQMVGFFIIGYYTALLTSALACVVKNRLEFQQKLIAVRNFMEYYGMSELLQRRVVEHYELQNQLQHEIILPSETKHFLFDAPDYLKQDVLYSEVVLTLDGIPLFSKADSKFIIKMSETMDRHLIPPNVKFLHRGEVRRSLYAIRHGSMGVFESATPETPTFILESTAYFGLRDLLFGEPSHYEFRTLSYCLLYEIKHQHFLDVFKEDEELLDHLDQQKGSLKTEPDERQKVSSKADRDKIQDRSIDIPNWINFKPSRTNQMQQMKYTEFQDYFDQFSLGRYWRIFLLNGVVHPVGSFSAWWTSWISLITCLVLCCLFMETFMYVRTPTFRTLQVAMESFYYMDVYLKLHWAYYLKNGILVTHPLKTAGMYIFEGSFFYDVMVCSHPEIILVISGYVNSYGHGPGATWFTKVRWVKILLLRKIPQIFQITHTVFVYRNVILLALYVSITLVVCTIVASIALGLSCPWDDNDWNEGDQYRLPYCLDETWAATKGGSQSASEVMASFTNRWIVGLYYVCQVVLVIGFGDMITLKQQELYLLIFMSVFGFIFMLCIISDMTAAEVDSDEGRSRYIDKMKNLDRVMTREKVHHKIVRSVHEHLNHTWKQSKSLHPQDLFSDLHPSLKSDLYRAYVGDTLRKVPIFRDFAPNVLRNLCEHMRKLYFVTGERISRFGNLEYEMHIIMSGKVWITDRLLNYGCTLHKNESYGETTVISHNPRRFTVIAATNVEVFVINHEDFSKILDRYPAVRNLLLDRTGNAQHDYFEHKIYNTIEKLKLITGPEKDQQVEILLGRTSEVKRVVYAREPPPEEGDELANTFTGTKKTFFRQHILSWGNDDDNLPLLYFSSQRSRSTGKIVYFPPLIHPQCTVMRRFFQLIIALCFFFPAVTFYELCFPPDKGGHTSYVAEAVGTISSEMQYIMVIYILVKFITPYQDSQYNFIKSSWSVVFNYATSLTGLLLDLLATIPPFFAPPSQNTNDGKRFLSLFRVLWLYRFYAHQLSKQDDLSVSAFEFKITLSLSSFCLMAHMLACVFYAFSACDTSQINPLYDNYCEDGTWTFDFAENQDIQLNIHKLLPWRWWIRSLYWVVTVISTTGYGDITAQNVGEMVIGVICMFCGAFILSIILSHFTAGLASLGKAHREFLYQVKLLVRYLRNVGLSSLRQFQINYYFEILWGSCRGSLYHNTTKILPTAMEIEVCNALYMPVLKCVKFFAIKDTRFIRQVAVRLTHSVYLPGVCIVKEGDPGNLMYIVYKGRVSGFVEDDLEQDLRAVYQVGDVFGIFPALFFDESYKKSYRAEEYTEIIALSQNDIIHLASIYQEFWMTLLAYVELHYDPSKESDCIFCEARKKAADLFDLGDDYGRFDTNVPTPSDRRKSESVNKDTKKEKKIAKELQLMKKQQERRASHAAPLNFSYAPDTQTNPLATKSTPGLKVVPSTSGLKINKEVDELESSIDILVKEIKKKVEIEYEEEAFKRTFFEGKKKKKHPKSKTTGRRGPTPNRPTHKDKGHASETLPKPKALKPQRPKLVHKKGGLKINEDNEEESLGNKIVNLKTTHSEAGSKKSRKKGTK